LLLSIRKLHRYGNRSDGYGGSLLVPWSTQDVSPLYGTQSTRCDPSLGSVSCIHLALVCMHGPVYNGMEISRWAPLWRTRLNMIRVDGSSPFVASDTLCTGRERASGRAPSGKVWGKGGGGVGWGVGEGVSAKKIDSRIEGFDRVFCGGHWGPINVHKQNASSLSS
jgi:hypothetical protein